MNDVLTNTPTIDFVAPLPGLTDSTRFELVPLDDEGVLYSLRSTDGSGLRLVLVAPGRFFPDYSPRIDQETVEALDLRDGSEAVVLNVVNIGSDPASATVNLLAPVVINSRTLRAGQAVLVGTDLPVRTPLLHR